MKKSKKGKKRNLVGKKQIPINETTKKASDSKSRLKNIIKNKDNYKNKWFFVILILIPILFFIILELSLQFFNYGYDTHQWVDAGNGEYVINPDIAKRYFNNIKSLPKTSEDIFDQQKKINSFRVFVLGGSSAAGYPYMPMGSFSRYIRKRLELVYPQTKIEVVNISMTAVGSYTILDLLPGVLEQKPDLILIYAGHNEYYGALGVGSLESNNAPRWAIKLSLYLNKFKTTQLIRNSISWFLSLFKSESNSDQSSTLMSRMAKDQYILLNSEVYEKGIKQFKQNLTEILTLAKNKKVPVIIGRLTSNLKDQKPFISVITPNYKTADKVYSKAQIELKEGAIDKADSLFKLAKDLDALRFRAPEKMNDLIVDLGKEFKDRIVPIDSIFNKASQDGIVGNNLMVDHLHPNLKGYELMGKAFYETMYNSGYLPMYEKPQIPYSIQDSVTKADFVFTQLDSTIGDYVVALLKSDWPFTEKVNSQSVNSLLKAKTFIDSIAVDYLEHKISWAGAHISAATSSLRKDDIKAYLKYMDELIYQYPGLKDINTAVKYFYDQNKINPGDYTTKRIGLIALYNNEYKDAIHYLSQKEIINSKDTQALNGLALAYFKIKDIDNALNTINKSLKIDPKNLEAKKLKQKILANN